MKKLILIASVILLKSIGFSQDTITTIPVFESDNGYNAISFEVVAASSINITSISNWWSNGTNTTDIWIKQGPINGTGTLVVNNSNGWYLHQSGVTVNGANTNGPASWVSGMNPINVAAGNTIGIVLTGSMRYFTATTAPITTFTGAFAQINAGSPSNGFGGQIPNLGNNPRGFLGSIVLELDLIGNCANPFTNVITDNILATTAQINWTPGATNTSFWLEYGLAGFTPGTGTMISGTYPGGQPPINLTGLAVNSNYDYYVGEICNSGNDSIYSVSPYEFTTTRLCAPATNLAVTSILSTSADISWNHPGGANSFTINYGAGLSQTATSSPYTLTGLSPLSSYNIYVQADCGNVNGLSDSLGPISFTTPCGVLLPPQLEDFSGGFLPNSCWEQAGDGTPATGPSGFGTSSWANDGFGNVGFTGAVKVNLYTTGKNEWAITPQYDLSIGGRFQVEFDFGVFDWPTTTPGTLGSDDRVELLISRNGGTSWSSLVNYNNSYVTAPGGNHEIIPLPNDSGIVQFAIWATEGSVNDIEDNDVMFDDFEVTSIPSCPQPSNLSASNITVNSTDLSWVAGGTETAWDIQYGTSGFAPGSGTTVGVTSNPYSLTGLSTSTAYDYYVKAICAPGDSSFWTGPFAFSTISNPTCDYTINMIDTWGDGWNGASIDVSINGSFVASFANTNTAGNVIQTATFSALAGDSVSFSFTSGSWDSEITFEILDPTLSSLTSGYIPAPNPGFFLADASSTSSCQPPNCPQPSSLIASNTTVNSADLSWVAGGTETAWDIQHGTSGFAPGSGTTVGVTSNPYSLTGLSASTAYDYYIKAICAPGDSSTWAGPFTFTTAFQCPPNAICAGPYNAGDIPSDRDFISNGQISSCPGTLQVVIPAGFVIDSIATMYDFTAQGGAWMSEQISLLYLPSISTGEPNPAAGTGGSSAGTESYSRTTDFPIGLNVNGTVDIEIHAGRNWGGTGCNTIYNKIDNGTWMVIAYYGIGPTCPQPSSLSASNITANSADLSWVAGGTETAWDIQHGTSGFAPGSGTTVGVTSNPYSLAGLSASTAYDYYVKAICAPGDSSTWAGPFTFTTPCGVLLPPQLEDFSGGFLPNSCWEEAGDGTPATGPSGFGTSSWFNDGFGNVGFTGAVKVNLYTTGKNEWAITPQYDLSIGGRFQVEFDFGVFDWPTTTPGTLGSDDRVELLISRNGGTSWSSLVNYNNSYVTAPGGNHEIIPLPNDSGIVQFAIWATEGSVDDLEDNDVMFDNFEVASVPCQQPAALGTSNITASSADLTWTSVGNETAWGIQYGSSGFTLGTGNTDSVSSNPYSLTGLSGSSTYDLYVKAICAPGSSSWTGPFTFTTSCAPGTFQQSISSCNTYLWNGNNYDSSGIYIDSLQTNNGCDSIVTLVLTINNDTITQDVKVSCDSVFIWNGTPLNSSGQYIDTLQSINGCDSIVKLNITLNYTPDSSFTTQAICDGDSLKFGSSVYSITGLYTDTLQSWIGCDSISILDLLVTNITVSLDTSQLSLVANISGGTGPFNYNWSDGSTSSTLITDSSGLYTLVITDASGCISNTASYNVIFNTTGAISNTKDQLIIYPNPNNGQFIITNSEPINEIFISDLQGKNVYSNKNLNVNKLDIEVNNLEKGMYLVNIVTINGMNIKTVIIH